MNTTIGDIADIINGGTPSTSVDSYWDGDVQWVTPKDLGQLKRRYISSGERTISIEGVNHSSAKILPARSIILSSRAPIGYVAINTVPMATNQGCKGIVPSGTVLSEYLFYYLLFSNKLLNSLGTGATFKELSGTKLSTVSLPLPSLEEQQRIVGILDAEFEKIDALKANAEKNLQNAKDLFHAALKKELEPKQGWKVVELHEITEICLGLTHTPKYVDDGVPFVSVKDISSGYLDLSDTKRISRKEFESFPYGAKPLKGDVLFCRVGTMGHPMVLEIDEEFGIFVSVGFLRPHKDISPYYLRYWMLSPMFDKQVEDNVVGSTLKNLNTGWLKHFMIPIPPSKELPLLIDKLTLVENRCIELQDNYTQTIALCDDLKQALLRKAFSGEL